MKVDWTEWSPPKVWRTRRAEFLMSRPEYSSSKPARRSSPAGLWGVGGRRKVVGAASVPVHPRPMPIIWVTVGSRRVPRVGGGRDTHDAAAGEGAVAGVGVLGGVHGDEVIAEEHGGVG